jgi:soluble lytic murein transglycosylase-like protein
VTLRVLAAFVLLLVAVAGVSTPVSAATLRDGASAFAKGRLAEAEGIFSRATAQWPRESSAWLWLGVVQFNRGQTVLAERSIARAVSLAPRDATILLWWGHMLARIDRLDAAASAFRQAIVVGSDPRIRELASQALRAVGPIPRTLAEQLAADAARVKDRSWVLNARSYSAIARHYNRRLAADEADMIGHALLGYSREFNLDPRFVVALVVIESGFQPSARSPVGAMGLGQLMPGTARSLGVNPWDPVQNLHGTIRYLRGNLDRFGWHKPHLALAAYNAGRGAVERYDGIPPYAETRWYVANVTSLYRRLLAISGNKTELPSRIWEN